MVNQVGKCTPFGTKFTEIYFDAFYLSACKSLMYVGLGFGWPHINTEEHMDIAQEGISLILAYIIKFLALNFQVAQCSLLWVCPDAVIVYV